MGTLIGHVAPGLGFFMIGLWHLYNHLKLLALNGPHNYKSLPWFPIGSKSNKNVVRPLELYLIMLGTAMSICMELFIGPRRHQPFDTDGTIPSNHLQNFEHSSISLTFFVYASFALALDRLHRPIPAQNDVVQFIGGLAFGQQLLVFHLHSADHMGVEGHYHWLLQLVVFISLATTLLGIRHVSSFNVAFVRSLSVMFQGLWLMVMGFALWTPCFIAKGCSMHEEQGHAVVRCDGDMWLHRAKALVNIQFSWFLILFTILTTSFYVVMMTVYGGDKMEVYALMSKTTYDEEDVEAQMIGGKLGETQRFVINTGVATINDKAIDHMER